MNTWRTYNDITAVIQRSLTGVVSTLIWSRRGATNGIIAKLKLHKAKRCLVILRRNSPNVVAYLINPTDPTRKGKLSRTRTELIVCRTGVIWTTIGSVFWTGPRTIRPL